MKNTATTRPAEAGTAPRRRPKAAEMVAAELRRQIASGRLKPGDKLHPENVLQVEFAISRPTLREALRLLAAEASDVSDDLQRLAAFSLQAAEPGADMAGVPAFETSATSPFASAVSTSSSRASLLCSW